MPELYIMHNKFKFMSGKKFVNLKSNWIKCLKLGSDDPIF